MTRFEKWLFAGAFVTFAVLVVARSALDGWIAYKAATDSPRVIDCSPARKP
jgi:hypothetical protein